MTAEYWEVHEAELLAEQEAFEWLLFEADMATNPYGDADWADRMDADLAEG